MGTCTELQPAGRAPILDLARGIALVVILIAHIYPNVLAEALPQNFGFSGMAEVFVFVSGICCGLAYGPYYQHYGIWWCTCKALLRVTTLYSAYVTAMLIIKSFAGEEFGQYDWSGGVESNYSATPSVSEILLMRHSYGDLPLLLLHIVFALIIVPAIALGGRRRMWLLSVSGLFYLAAQLPVLEHMVRLHSKAMYLEPCAWQLLFVVGIVVGLSKKQFDWSTPRSRLLVAVSIGIVQISLAAKLSLWIDETPPLSSQATLGPLRLCHFAALSVIVGGAASYLVRVNIFARLPWRLLCVVGRHSLFTFCFGEVLLIFANWFLRVAGYGVLSQIGVCVCAVSTNCIVSVGFDRIMSGQRLFVSGRCV